MFKQFAKALTSVTVVAVLGIGAALAQAPAPKQAKDQGEVDLYTQSSPATNPDATKRLAALNSWKEKYPDTVFKLERALFYALTYQALNQGQNMFEAAKEVLAIDPKEINALGWVTMLTPNLPATPDTLSTGEKAARGLLGAEQPAGVDPATWTKMKTSYAVAAHTTLAFVAIKKPDLSLAESEYKLALEADPGNAQSAYAVATTIIAQKKPERYPEAIFFLARAASMTGPGALTAASQKQVNDYFIKTYNTFHGEDAAGLANLRQLAVGPKPAPPEGFSLKDKATIDAEKQAEFAKSNPQLALWMSVKEQLTAPGGEQYFESTFKGAQVPKLKGKVISMQPAVRPKAVVLGIEKADVPEVTLKFETPLAGKADPGTEIEFEGIPSTFTKEPFMVTFDVEDKDKIVGWPAAAAPATKKGPAATKKGPAAKK